MSAAAVSAAQVKELRERTGMGMMECKKALVECEGDSVKAEERLRIKSGAKAGKLAGRRAGEGRIAFFRRGNVAALAEALCETDFVARNDDLLAFANAVAQAVAVAGAGEDLPALKLEGGETAEEARKRAVMKLGENIAFGRARVLRAEEGEQIAEYTHAGGKIVAACVYVGDAEMARSACMQIAAMRPRYVERSQVPQEFQDKEMEIFCAQAREEGKPEEMAGKIAAGKLEKRLAEVCLRDQIFIKEDGVKVGAALDAADTRVVSFALLAVGDNAD
jgi:elongation factor Ts